MSHYKHDEELGIAIVATLGDPQSGRVYHVDFKVYETTGWDEGETADFLAKGTIPKMSGAEETAVFAHGYVKWDGCSNWIFDEQRDGSYMMHACTRNGVLKFGTILAACWDWASELMPVTWDVD